VEEGEEVGEGDRELEDEVEVEEELSDVTKSNSALEEKWR